MHQYTSFQVFLYSFINFQGQTKFDKLQGSDGGDVQRFSMKGKKIKFDISRDLCGYLYEISPRLKFPHPP